MGKISGFKEFKRIEPSVIPPEERIKHSKEFLVQLPTEKLNQQAARCMDCGIPFCHQGCPLGNFIPEWNDSVYQDDWQQAALRLHQTNNFPEITGRVCPAPCESACVLAINDKAVTIKNIELEIVERAFREGLMASQKTVQKKKEKVAIIGSGPAGLACAEELVRDGYQVDVYERADKIGGLLRYGIPDFKLEKWVLDRRIEMMKEQGVNFHTSVEVGKDLEFVELQNKYDSIVLAIGSNSARDLNIPGRELEGVHFAMEYLAQENARISESSAWQNEQGWWFGKKNYQLSAKDKNVIILGGGDSGSDCLGTANRQGAKSVLQFDWKNLEFQQQHQNVQWPNFSMYLKSSSSHEEGGERQWGFVSKRFIGENGKLTGLETVEVNWSLDPQGKRVMHVKENSEKIWPVDLVLIACGFSGIENSEYYKKANLDTTFHNTFLTNTEYMTNLQGVFACGDARRGQSLVVWAIAEGRKTAKAVDKFLSKD
ncbi:MAG: glutamate synthase subunit beta [Proteobacteria bacterium]|nr:glutamate synthase subunit beta [Pseudomonadota bacterium]